MDECSKKNHLEKACQKKDVRYEGKKFSELAGQESRAIFLFLKFHDENWRCEQRRLHVTPTMSAQKLSRQSNKAAKHPMNPLERCIGAKKRANPQRRVVVGHSNHPFYFPQPTNRFHSISDTRQVRVQCLDVLP